MNPRLKQKKIRRIVRLLFLIAFMAPIPVFAKIGEECVAQENCDADEVCQTETIPEGTPCLAHEQCQQVHGAQAKCILPEDCADPLNCPELRTCVTITGTCQSNKAAAVVKPSLEVTKPSLQIAIPTITSFADVKVEEDAGGGQFATFPWIGQYIKAAYLYLLGIAGLIAVIVFIHAGFEWVASGGNTHAIEGAKKKILNASIGMAILFGSYTILYAINPDLVRFAGLRVQILEHVPLPVFEGKTILDNEPEMQRASKPISNTTYDTVFKQFAGCTGTDWRVLKVIAYKESGLNPDVVNKFGFTGLFQTKKNFCESALSAYHKESLCSDLTNPFVNTAVGAAMTKDNVKYVNKYCPDVPLQDFYILVYIGHNSGGGALVSVLKKSGCDPARIEDSLVEFWKSYKKGKLVDEADARGRYKYAVSVAKLILSQGVASKEDASNKLCPLKGTWPDSGAQSADAYEDAIY